MTVISAPAATGSVLPSSRSTAARYSVSAVAGIAQTTAWPYILGDTFMQGLVAVFDTHPERMEMRFAKRIAGHFPVAPTTKPPGSA